MGEPLIFVSYSHKDKNQKEELVVHLRSLQHLGIIDPWTDDKIEAGDRWLAAIEQALEKARIAILIVTENFLASKFIQSEEVPALLQRLTETSEHKLTVIPFITRQCNWKIFEWMNELQVRPNEAKPVWSAGRSYRDRVQTELMEEIARILQADQPLKGVFKAKHEANKAKARALKSDPSMRPSAEVNSPIQLTEAGPAVESEQDAGLLTPAMLQFDATVPQCLDNQYVSERVFRYMIKHGADYSDPKVNAWRKKDTNTEFIRSLVYSSQVVINRAFLKNNKFLYQNFSNGNKNLAAFAELVKNKVIVPYLNKELSLTDRTTFDTRDEGEKAIRTLVEKIGQHVPCVRLALPDADADGVDDRENLQMAAHMETSFGSYFLGLRAFQEGQINQMMSELFSSSSNTPNAEEFRPHLLKLRSAVDRCLDANPVLYRSELYKELFIAGNEKQKGVNTALGKFRKPTKADPFLYELKKLVDLRYNSNLPDYLRRYTFTPLNMPSRLALQDGQKAAQQIESRKTVALLDDLRDHFVQIQRKFMANAHKGMNLPFLGELSIADVIEARRLDEWHEFARYQQEMLKEPLEIANRLESFQYKLEQFQKAMSDWYYEKYPTRRKKEIYASYATFALQAGGQLIALGLDPRTREVGGSAELYNPETLAGKKVNDYDLLLMINVIDLKKQKLDRDRSYGIEIVRDDAGLKGEKLIDLINSFRDVGGDPVDYSAASDLAEQG